MACTDVTVALTLAHRVGGGHLRTYLELFISSSAEKAVSSASESGGRDAAKKQQQFCTWA